MIVLAAILSTVYLCQIFTLSEVTILVYFHVALSRTATIRTFAKFLDFVTTKTFLSCSSGVQLFFSLSTLSHPNPTHTPHPPTHPRTHAGRCILDQTTRWGNLFSTSCTRKRGGRRGGSVVRRLIDRWPCCLSPNLFSSVTV